MSEILTINRSKTYRNDVIETHDESVGTSVKIHNLNERTIRECEIKYQEKVFKAINGQSIWAFVKEQFKEEKALPQTVAKLILPNININDSFRVNNQFNVCFPNPPWNMVESFEFRSKIVYPRINQINIYPEEKCVSTLLLYPIVNSNKIIINEGDFHE